MKYEDSDMYKAIQSNEEQRLKWACYSALHHHTDADIKRVRTKPFLLVLPHQPLPHKYTERYTILPVASFNVVSLQTGTVIDNVDGYTHIALLRPVYSINEDDIRELILNRSVVPTSYTSMRTFLDTQGIKYRMKRASMTLLKLILDPADEYKGQYWGDEQQHNWYVFTIRDAPPTLVFDKETTRRIDDTTTVTAVRVSDSKARNTKYQRDMRRNKAHEDIYYIDAVSYIFDGWDASFEGDTLVYKKVREPSNDVEFNRKGRESIQQYFESIYNTFLSDDDIDANVVRYIRAHIMVNEMFNKINDIPTDEDEITFARMVKEDIALRNRVLYGSATPSLETIFDNTTSKEK